MAFKKNEKGFSVVEALIIVVILAVVGLVGWKVMGGNSNKDSKDSDSDTKKSQTSEEQPGEFIWQQTATGWQASQEAPECPDQPMLKAPADLSKVTSVLYPGQTRGSYKPHGGLRFDDVKDNKVTVKAPFDGFIVKAARNFAEGTTEVQYNFDIMSNCGVMTRLGHLRELPDDMQAIVEKLPEASADSRIESVNPPVFVKQGTVLATQVGIKGNTFFDWGVYDYRQENEVSKLAAYKAAHPQGEHAWFAVCWLKDWLPASDAATLAKLEAGGGESAKQSDYCE